MNYSLGISFSYIRDLAFCIRGSDHVCSSLIPFLGQVKQLSSMDQYPSPTFTLIFCRVLPPWYLEIIMELHNFL